MKKIISILLVVLTVFSVTATFASAEDSTPGTYIVEFYDDNGSTLVKTITVYYGQDFNKEAPEFDSYIVKDVDGVDYKVVHDGWMIMNYKTYEGQAIPKGNLPALEAADKPPAVLKIKAQYKAYENNIENNIKDTVSNMPGAEVFTNMSDFFNSIIELIRSWFMNIALFFNAFM